MSLLSMVEIHYNNGGLLASLSNAIFNHTGGWTLAMMGVFTLWKSANTTNHRCPLPPTFHQEQLLNIYQHPTTKSACQSTLREHNLHPACSNHFPLCPMVTPVTSLIGLTG